MLAEMKHAVIMKSRRVAPIWLFTATSLLCGMVACKPSAPPAAPVEQYVPVDGAVPLDLMRSGATDEGQQRWLVTYTDGLHSTRFTVELEPPSKGGVGAPGTGKGKFVAQADSDPLPLLESMQKALQAKRLPTGVQKADELPFTYLMVGENQSRTSNGSFRSLPAGNWSVMKIFLADDQAQLYLNLNPALHQAEFSIKDAAYGDRVLAELARVF